MLLRGNSAPIIQRPPEWVAALIGAAMVLLMAWWRVDLARHVMLPVGYGAPIVIVAWFRRRRVLWAVTAAFVLLTIYKFFFFLPANVIVTSRAYDIGAGFLVLVDIALVTAVAHVWIATQDGLERQNSQLESVNSELVTREEEIARQNEELQSQTEELERQSEELRVANDELANREKTLQTLLNLSRSLATELSRDETLSRICETLGDLVNGPTIGSAVLEHRGDRMVVRCHHGFGPEGLEADSIPASNSFAALVLSRDRTGYLEDIGLRPDLSFAQPKAGARFLSVLAAPLRVSGKPVGTLEVYGRERMNWSDEQIALVESLAAQTSVSLEAADLFETVSIERQRFATVLHTVPFGIAVADGACDDIRMNPAGAAILNVPPDVNVAPELRRRAWQVFQDNKPLAPDQVPVIRACREGVEMLSQELELLVGDRRLILLVNARPIRDSELNVTGAVSAFVDITPLKELQRELDVRRREAEEASVRKTRFLAAVSHDIRTPANAISLLAELIRRTAANPAMAGDIPQLAVELHGSALALVNLLGDVLDVTRYDSGRIELQESDFNLNELLKEEIRQLQPLARDRQLELRTDLPPSAIWLRCDRIKLSRILGNLVGNAIKFTDKGEIRVEAALTDGGSVQIRVIDSGVGMAAESLANIFDEFFQLRNPERDRNKGTGLGLTICKRLLDAMGGQIDVASTPGQGSTFTVTLPPIALLPTR